jgi:uncharacterized protein YggT (Ycf19 family)
MDYVIRGVYSGITIYMILILLRWLGPWIGLELEYGKLVWLKKITDPVLEGLRKSLPTSGPFDITPIVALFGFWFARTLVVRILVSSLPMTYM